MGPTNRKNKRDQGNTEVDNSWLYSKTGNHTTGIIIGILFLFVLIPLIISMFQYPSLADKIITAFLTLLFALAGFYTGTKSRIE